MQGWFNTRKVVNAFHNINSLKIKKHILKEEKAFEKFSNLLLNFKNWREFPQLPKGTHKNSLPATSIFNNKGVTTSSKIGTKKKGFHSSTSISSDYKPSRKWWASKLALAFIPNITTIHVEKQTI